MHRPWRPAGCCSAALLLALCSTAARSDPVKPGPEEEAPAREEARADELPSETEGIAGRVFRIVRKPLPDFRISQTGLVGSDFGDLSLSTARTNITAGVAFPVSKRGALRIRGSGQFAVYEFSGTRALFGSTTPPQTDFGDFFSNRWEVIGRYKFTDRWAGIAGLRFGSSVEAGASYGDGIRGGGLVGFGFRSSSDFTLVLGVVLGSRYDRGGVSLGPLIDFKWQISERYKLESTGLSLRFTGTMNDRLDLFVASRITGIRYRLANRPIAGPCPPPGGGDCVPALGQGSMRDRWVPVVVGADWEFAKHWVLRAHVGAVAYRQIKFRNEDGEDVSSHTTDGPALLLGLRVRFRY